MSLMYIILDMSPKCQSFTFEFNLVRFRSEIVEELAQTRHAQDFEHNYIHMNRAIGFHGI